MSEENQIQKRFPANTVLDEVTFLNDKKVDGELYALYQEYSRPVEEDGEYITIVNKKDLPTQAVICAKLGIKSAKTYRSHRDYLVDSGYVIDDVEQGRYILPNKESIFLMIPLRTLQFLNDTIKEQVIKVYIYLGQRWKFKKDYVFTVKEVGQHIGVKVDNDSRAYTLINNALLCLESIGLIKVENISENIGGKPVPKKKLVNFTFELNG